MKPKHSPGKPPVSPLNVDLSFDEFMKKAAVVPKPEKPRKKK